MKTERMWAIYEEGFGYRHLIAKTRAAIIKAFERDCDADWDNAQQHWGCRAIQVDVVPVELAVGREITSAALQHEASDDRIKPLQGVEMILKEAVYEVCKTCGERKRIKDEMYCCDNCLKELEGSSLELAKYSSDNEYETFHFCSWECFFKKGEGILA